MMLRGAGALLMVAILAACGGAGASSATQSATQATPTLEPAVATALVGEWVGIHDCEKIVTALREAGFGENVVLENVLGNGLVPDASRPEDLEDPADPCRDAVPREHSHFFTPDGEFGSRDFDGNQVDDGSYRVIDADTVRISTSEFGFTIDGDTLQLTPIVPDGCMTFECQWSIMVAMAGEPLTRSDP